MNQETPMSSFPPGGFVRAHLLREPLYVEDTEMWNTLLREQQDIASYFQVLGMQLVVDIQEGYAYLRQIEPLGDERVPRLLHKRKLTYDATLLLVCLRDELNRFDSSMADQSRIIRSRKELQDLVAGFLKESNNQVRDVKRIDSAIEQLGDLGFLKALTGSPTEQFELKRIIKARFGPGELEAVRNRLLRHVAT